MAKTHRATLFPSTLAFLVVLPLVLGLDPLLRRLQQQRVPGGEEQEIRAMLHTVNRVATDLLNQNRQAEAASLFASSLQLVPTDGRVSYNYGVCLKELGRIPESLHAYQRAVQLVPNLSEAHFNLGRTYQMLADDNRASASAPPPEDDDGDDADDAHPTILGGLYNANSISQRRRALELAVAHFHRAGRGRADTWRSMEESLTQLGRHDEALDAYYRFIHAAPEQGVRRRHRDSCASVQSWLRLGGPALMALRHMPTTRHGQALSLEARARLQAMGMGMRVGLFAHHGQKESMSLAALAEPDAAAAHERIPVASGAAEGPWLLSSDLRDRLGAWLLDLHARKGADTFRICNLRAFEPSAPPGSLPSVRPGEAAAALDAAAASYRTHRVASLPISVLLDKDTVSLVSEYFRRLDTGFYRDEPSDRDKTRDALLAKGRGAIDNERLTLYLADLFLPVVSAVVHGQRASARSDSDAVRGFAPTPRRLKTAFVKTASYKDGASLPVHRDNAHCVVSVSFVVDSFRGAASREWPLVLQHPPWARKGASNASAAIPGAPTDGDGLVKLSIPVGAAAVFDGRHFLHWRDELAAPGNSTVLLFHYVDADLPEFDCALDLPGAALSAGQELGEQASLEKCVQVAGNHTPRKAWTVPGNIRPPVSGASRVATPSASFMLYSPCVAHPTLSLHVDLVNGSRCSVEYCRQQFNNQLWMLYNALAIARRLRRTLVLPPFMHMAHQESDAQRWFPASHFIDLAVLRRRGFDVIDWPDFLAAVHATRRVPQHRPTGRVAVPFFYYPPYVIAEDDVAVYHGRWLARWGIEPVARRRMSPHAEVKQASSGRGMSGVPFSRGEGRRYWDAARRLVASHEAAFMALQQRRFGSQADTFRMSADKFEADSVALLNTQARELLSARDAYGEEEWAGGRPGGRELRGDVLKDAAVPFAQRDHATGERLRTCVFHPDLLDMLGQLGVSGKAVRDALRSSAADGSGRGSSNDGRGKAERVEDVLVFDFAPAYNFDLDRLNFDAELREVQSATQYVPEIQTLATRIRRNLFRGRRYLSAHLRRDGYEGFCFGPGLKFYDRLRFGLKVTPERCFPSANQVASQLVSWQHRLGVDHVYLATNAAADEIQRLRQLGVRGLHSFQSVPADLRLAMLGEHVPMVEQLICADGAGFLGTLPSTFSATIVSERDNRNMSRDSTGFFGV